MSTPEKVLCPLCADNRTVVKEVIRQKPVGETDYNVPPLQYERAIYQCRGCQVYFNQHSFIPEGFYNGFYNEASYRGRMAERYQKIRALSPAQSDNKQRAARIDAFLEARGKRRSTTRILDVGSGLCVFLAEMKDRGYRCFAIDPDGVATTHARAVVGVEGAHTGTLESFGDTVEYDLITFNKVLEHVLVPVPELRRAAKLLRPDGFVYVELPDGNDASRHGGFVDRQEFYIEHLTIYNDPSLRFLAQQAGYECLEVRPVHEPSGKFSIYSFLRPL